MSAATNLARARTRFVGRAGELAAVGDAFDAGARLVTLVGPPGIGKTRLAREFALAASESAGEAAWFCDLTAARSEDDVVAVMASVLRVPLHRASGDAPARLATAIAGLGRVLLVLDNFEYAAGAARGLLERVLDEAPAAALLLTSVVRLGIEGERVLELRPLGEDEGVALFEDRARAVRADVRLGPAERHEALELVRRLDGIPLAIELAAARVNVLSPKQLLSRLSSRFALLRSERGGRHGSLLASIAWAWDLLSAAEQDALAQCAVFEGGFTLEAAERVVQLSAHAGAPPVLDVLESLRARSLLQLAEGDPPRLFLYESVREFARLELEKRGGAREAEARHASELVRDAEGWLASVGGPLGLDAIRRLSAERANLLAAQRRLRERNPAMSARAGLALAVVLALQGPEALEVEVLESALDGARRAGDDALLARALRARASQHARQGKLPQARAAIDEAISRAVSAGLRALEGRCRSDCARVFLQQGDVAAARAQLERALALHRADGDLENEGYALNGFGMVEESVGDVRAAAIHFDAALRTFRRCGYRRFQGIVLLNLAIVRSAEGGLDDARALLDEGLAIMREAEDRAGEADALVNLGHVELTAGRLAEADAVFRSALKLERELGNRRFEALAQGNLGLVAFEQGEWRAARERLRQAHAAFEECSEPRFRSIFQPFLAAAEAALGDTAAARAHLEEARAQFVAHADAANLAVADVLEGFVTLAEAGPDGGAEAALRARLARRDRPRSAELVVAERLLARALDARVARGPVNEASADEGEALAVGAEARWFRVPRGEQVDLTRRGPLRRVLHALVEQRQVAPGVGLAAARVFELGWPGERASHEAAAARVYTAIRTLRASGLETILLRRDDGYLLDPALGLVRET